MKNLTFLKRLNFALNGIRIAFLSEKSFKTQTACVVASLCFFALMKASPVWWALWAVCAAGVLSFELLNTALEKLIDYLHPQKHDEIRFVKDCAAGAVLVFSFATLVVFVAFLFNQLS